MIPEPGQPGLDPTITRLDAHPPVATPEGLAPGQRIGAFELIRLLGQGGMGVVYLARQQWPSRLVALKLIHPAVISPEAMRRFEHEAQVLARLQHPGIAAIHDAGSFSTATGPQSYLVIEYIEGATLTAYAASRRLNVAERIGLFMHVCDAVQYAHLKGVIHRDLKPANILVSDAASPSAGAEARGLAAPPAGESGAIATRSPGSRIPSPGRRDASQACPKILDFGVARVTDNDFQSRTMHTTAGQLLGTIPYMSPEQISGDPLDVDTRTDVYSLGVILYELLTGRHAYDVSSRSVPDAARIIREEDPRPLSSFNRTFRGDLDTIVRRALEKDKTLRYQSAAELAADLRRFLNDEPIVARPPSRVYLFRKFANRHKGLVAGLALAGIILAAGTGVSLYLAIDAYHAKSLAEARRVEADEARKLAEARAERARVQADKAREVAEFLQTMLAAVDPETAAGRDTEILRDILEEASRRIETELKNQPEVEAAVRDTLGVTYRQIALYDAAHEHLTKAVELRRSTLGAEHADTLASMSSLASLYYAMGRYEDAARLAEDVQNLRRRSQAPPQQIASGANDLAAMLQAEGRYEEAEALYREALAAREAELGEDHADVATVLNNLAVLLGQLGQNEEAESLHRRALRIRVRAGGEDSLDAILSRQNLAVILEAQGEFAEAEALYRGVLEVYTKVFGPEHPASLKVTGNLAVVLNSQQKDAEAETLFKEVIARYAKAVGEDHPDALVVVNNYALLCYRQQRDEEARMMFARIVEARRRVLGPEHPDLALACNNLAQTLQTMNRSAEAEPHFREALGIYEKVLGQEHPLVASTRIALARALMSQGRYRESEPVLQEALRIRRKTLPDDVISISEAVGLLGENLIKLDRFPDAEPLLLESYSRLVALPDPRGPDVDARVSAAARRLVQLYERWNKPDKAAEWAAKQSGS
ncbi:MAG: serine/threonine-protein kinase [Phycisphaerae bacterium]|nr:MAG: serine/threonine protein kinase [Planctomycetota bacterium]KAB2949802.1 MAG: serine/threonine protein kinase [Phycisphaerae bacterium]MBE7456992.1 serine/threonine protein kinase [Planctomycetia bacterium]MCK6463649.1 serine/threonine-protein kinase [Phycisphaerae bacterium]MCL4718318.1 serine/threonine-protein kinase [Phycisphaerae bacterium]